jgi:hypothetical protein
MKGSHEFPPSNSQEQCPENTSRKPSREVSENHYQEQPGKTQQSLEEPRRIIYTYQGGSYKVLLATRSSNPLTRSHHEALKLVLWKSQENRKGNRKANELGFQEMAAILSPLGLCGGKLKV